MHSTTCVTSFACVLPDRRILIDDISHLGSILHEVLHDVALVTLERQVKFFNFDERIENFEELRRLVAMVSGQLHDALHLVGQHFHARLLVADENFGEAFRHLGFGALHVEEHVDAVEQTLLHLFVASSHALEEGEGLLEDSTHSTVLLLNS